MERLEQHHPQEGPAGCFPPGALKVLFPQGVTSQAVAPGCPHTSTRPARGGVTQHHWSGGSGTESACAATGITPWSWHWLGELPNVSKYTMWTMSASCKQSRHSQVSSVFGYPLLARSPSHPEPQNPAVPLSHPCAVAAAQGGSFPPDDPESTPPNKERGHPMLPLALPSQRMQKEQTGLLFFSGSRKCTYFNIKNKSELKRTFDLTIDFAVSLPVWCVVSFLKSHCCRLMLVLS